MSVQSAFLPCTRPQVQSLLSLSPQATTDSVRSADIYPHSPYITYVLGDPGQLAFSCHVFLEQEVGQTLCLVL